ncbi:hypothetical protein DSM104440_00997 [Usitatibacter palustris]|uniref:Uncharacterized protein n=2 Tax=Usitatibacter palustris TaxID=2732487 RepID=A0A6M4H740_9PROT|nr:hypothetical protein DSM104440_00997 [Usitatibacter palustris]
MRLRAEIARAEESSRNVVQAVRENDWRQGDVLPSAARHVISPFVSAPFPPDAWVIVLTQSCDLVHNNLAAEPSAEVIVASPITDEDKEVRHLRNPRRLQIEGAQDQNSVLLDLRITQRHSIPKWVLAGHEPDGDRMIPEGDLRTLVQWVAARYDRRAFPDAFMDRLKPVDKNLQKAWKRMRAVTCIYLSISSYEELPEESPYRVALIAAMTSEDFESADLRGQMEVQLGRVTAAMDDCGGIEIERAELRPEGEISLEELRLFGRWYLDTYSDRDEQHRAPPGNSE